MGCSEPPPPCLRLGPSGLPLRIEPQSPRKPAARLSHHGKSFHALQPLGVRAGLYGNPPEPFGWCVGGPYLYFWSPDISCNFPPFFEKSLGNRIFFLPKMAGKLTVPFWGIILAIGRQLQEIKIWLDRIPVFGQYFQSTRQEFFFCQTAMASVGGGAFPYSTGCGSPKQLLFIAQRA